jgi:hypothetical protein
MPMNLARVVPSSSRMLSAQLNSRSNGSKRGHPAYALLAPGDAIGPNRKIKKAHAPTAEKKPDKKPPSQQSGHCFLKTPS